MTARVLELNDAGLAIGDGGALFVESPGYATFEAGEVLLGEAARARARIAPRQTHTRFWQRLGLEPLHGAPAQVRHHADLAWRHLQQVHAQAGSPEELILAVPGNFTREQLAILLGIAERCAFRAIGLVDSALAAAAGVPGEAGALLHVEAQLHQCVLTRIDQEDGQLVRREARALPGTGLVELQERWARRAAAAFIQQTRYDPLHDAASEQQLYSALPAWLGRLATDEDTGAELQAGANRHLARLRAADMLGAVRPVYAELLEAIARDGAGRHLLLGARIASLPRFTAHLQGARVLDRAAGIRGALAQVALVRSEERALRFVTRLPAPGQDPGEAKVRAGAAPPVAVRPVTPPGTHLLDGDRALRLAHERQYLHRTPEGWRLGAAGAGSACCIHRGQDGWIAEASEGMRLRVDGRDATGPVRLATGSRLAPDGAAELRLIAETAASDDGA
jgi:hypothetical protein